jgi:hypothetical protein
MGSCRRKNGLLCVHGAGRPVLKHRGRQQVLSFVSVPLLVGGATTSKKHTAVKIAPPYDGVTLHVPDASRAAGVVGFLLSDGRIRPGDGKPCRAGAPSGGICRAPGPSVAALPGRWLAPNLGYEVD